MQFDVTKIDDVRKLQQMLTPRRYWSALLRILPRAMTPVLVAMRAAAPRGETGKLSRGFDVRVQPIRQGLIYGIEVDVGARVPYGHLVEFGHRIVPRGPQRKGLKLSRARRKELRTRLQSRQLQARGQVAGVGFAVSTLQARQGQVIGLVERLLEQEMQR